MALVDASGIEALTMRRVGEALGVEAMSLYNHLPGKEALLDGLVGLVFAEMELPSRDIPWKEALRQRTLSAQGVLRRHPWATPYMASRKTPGAATLRHHDAVLGCLRAGGVSLLLAVHAVSAIDGYLYGFTLQQRALPFETEAEVAEVAAGLMEGFPVSEFPHLAEFLGGHALKPGYDYALEFEFGLDLILDGLERHRRSGLL